MSDIEAGLGLGRKQLVAMALLVGNDHDLVGVPGIGIETALRFVQQFSDDEVLYRCVPFLIHFPELSTQENSYLIRLKFTF